ncbi:MAG: carbohydrate ABC transporter permease [Anaerolineae bacterium]|nr:carbohydrate ABC transporter permease [Anaerolineae bacterium]MCO5190888.1 carbohydrate ABC transporter permease [Anaerolineae bacterium]MCO5197544.1 carbohydrate ABC transporter permease [Anaerolineae bacterium]MCO5205765.1 carbohydrate ABC transporter permease [Anaerolineae bacterium]
MRNIRIGTHHAVAIAITVLFLLPLFWAAGTSLRTVGAPPPNTVTWWPRDAQWGNYGFIFELVPMARYLRNSLLVVALAVPITLLTASLAGFAMSQLSNKAQRRLLIFSVLLLMIPGASVWLFRFQILSWLGLLDTIWALVAPAFAASSPLFVLLYYWNFRRVPQETFEAARLDGASAVMSWRRIALPLARGTTIGVVILTFVLYWSDFVSPVLYIFDTAWYTLPVGLQILKQFDATNWPLLMAGAVIMTVPVIVLFIVLQRFFLSDFSVANLFDRG